MTLGDRMAEILRQGLWASLTGWLKSGPEFQFKNFLYFSEFRCESIALFQEAGIMSLLIHSFAIFSIFIYGWLVFFPRRRLYNEEMLDGKDLVTINKENN